MKRIRYTEDTSLDLPTELWILILEFTPSRALYVFKFVNKTIHQIVSQFSIQRNISFTMTKLQTSLDVLATINLYQWALESKLFDNIQNLRPPIRVLVADEYALMWLFYNSFETLANFTYEDEPLMFCLWIQYNSHLPGTLNFVTPISATSWYRITYHRGTHINYRETPYWASILVLLARLGNGQIFNLFLRISTPDSDVFSNCCYEAAYNGHLSILECLRKIISSTSKSIDLLQILKGASMSGCLDIFKWYNQYYDDTSSGFDARVTYTLAKNNHFESLKWTLENGYRSDTGGTFECAFFTKHGNLKALQYLHRVGFTRDRRCIILAIKHGHTSILDWLLDVCKEEWSQTLTLLAQEYKLYDWLNKRKIIIVYSNELIHVQ